MSERDCNTCIHKTDEGCEKWDCAFEQKHRYIDADNLKLYFASYLQRGKLEKGETVHYDNFDNWCISGTEMREAIDRELTADVRENIRGEWIDYVNSHCECPFCHSEWSYFENMVEYFNFCPNCGADMKGEKDEH